MTEPLLTAQQVARMLNVRPSTVYEWARMEYIPCVRLGVGKTRPCLRFRREAVMEWLEEKEQEGRASRVPELEPLRSRR